MAWVILCVAAVAVILFVFVELKARRKTSIEGIEDHSAVQAYDYLSQGPQFKAMRAIFSEELKRYHPRGTLADVGCGPGYLLEVMARRFSHLHLVGVDISEEIITKARENLSGFKNVEFKVAGSHRLPFADDSLDFLVSTLSLHHWAKPAESFQEFYRVLRPGGEFLVFDVRRNPPILVHLMFRLVTAVVMPEPLRKIAEPLGSLLSSYTPGEVRDILSDTPFKDFRVKKGFFWLFIWGRKVYKE